MPQVLTDELRRIGDELSRAYDGDPWHGPSLQTALDGLPPDVARARPVPGGHTIWEIVVHLSSWDDVVTRRIAERRAVEEPEAGNFPPIDDSSPDAWPEALAELDRQHARLRETVRTLDPSRLLEPVPGKDYTLAFILHGVAQHMAYHAGQIALLRKLCR